VDAATGSVAVVASANGVVGIPTAMDILCTGGSALDAVEQAARVVEDNADDHTVGYGGYPNVNGDVELDASIMDGSTRLAGAVGALSGYRHPISVARLVMETFPHVLIVGAGAAAFAEEMGMHSENLLTDEARRTWQEGIDGTLDPAAPVAEWLGRVRRLGLDENHLGGTVNFIAKDQQGHLAVAVSTSGTAWKYPGRLGDSPIIGAGNYADDLVGAAACTGWGELSIRASTARMVVEGLRRGDGLEESLVEAIRDLGRLGGVESGAIVMQIVAISKSGELCGASSRSGSEYAYQTGDMAGPALRRSTWVDLTSGRT
jgi:beta-aspartyl-peptidase (threonine type)